MVEVVSVPLDIAQATIITAAFLNNITKLDCPLLACHYPNGGEGG